MDSSFPSQSFHRIQKDFKISDAGDISAATVEEGHSKLEKKLFSLLQAGKKPITIGGGDDQSYANAMGFLADVYARGGVKSDTGKKSPKNSPKNSPKSTPRSQKRKEPGSPGTGKKPKAVVINIDAHLDVRTRNDEGQVHSGCPFRLMMQSDLWKKLDAKHVAFACQGQACSKAHVEYCNPIYLV